MGVCRGAAGEFIRWQVQQRIYIWVFGAIALYCLVALGCTAPDRYRKIAIGITSEEVLALLGEPDSKERRKKQVSTVEYFGPKPSDAYLDLPDDALIEIWSYRYLRETWTYVFSLEEQKPRLVDTGYHHPDIVY